MSIAVVLVIVNGLIGRAVWLLLRRTRSNAPVRGVKAFNPNRFASDRAALSLMPPSVARNHEALIFGVVVVVTVADVGAAAVSGAMVGGTGGGGGGGGVPVSSALTVPDLSIAVAVARCSPQIKTVVAAPVSACGENLAKLKHT